MKTTTQEQRDRHIAPIMRSIPQQRLLEVMIMGGWFTTWELVMKIKTVNPCRIMSSLKMNGKRFEKEYDGLSDEGRPTWKYRLLAF